MQVARAAAGALRTLAFKNEENKNQIVECGALPTLIQMLRSDDVGLHYEAVGVIGNLVSMSFHLLLYMQYIPASCAVSWGTQLKPPARWVNSIPGIQQVYACHG